MLRIRKYGHLWQCELLDDGTLDAVIRVQDVRQQWPAEEFHFSDTSDLRRADGSFTKRGFRQLCEQAVDEYTDAGDHYCPKCGQAFIVHNDDGSCVQD